ncbi:MAG TPA: hypothetical protein VFD73_08300, partial [Gemmatimonadales bacterium]|nr:hypothetical protein [Gemmatimonadales bacterium]
DPKIRLGMQPGLAAVATQVRGHRRTQHKMTGRFEASARSREGSHISPCVTSDDEHQHARSGKSGAPRSALLYPRRSREELGGRFLGLMAYLDPKGEGDQSMPGKQWPCPGVRARGAAGPAEYGES